MLRSSAIPTLEFGGYSSFSFGIYSSVRAFIYLVAYIYFYLKSYMNIVKYIDIYYDFMNI
jgi:hypothetical protein